MVLAMLNREQYNILAALQQVDNITHLLEDNDWKEYIYSHLTPIRFELERQYQNLQEQNGKKI
jgi:hypothetical protein